MKDKPFKHGAANNLGIVIDEVGTNNSIHIVPSTTLKFLLNLRGISLDELLSILDDLQLRLTQRLRMGDCSNG